MYTYSQFLRKRFLELDYVFFKPRFIMQTETWNKRGLSHHRGGTLKKMFSYYYLPKQTKNRKKSRNILFIMLFLFSSSWSVLSNVPKGAERNTIYQRRLCNAVLQKFPKMVNSKKQKWNPSPENLRGITETPNNAYYLPGIGPLLSNLQLQILPLK